MGTGDRQRFGEARRRIIRGADRLGTSPLWRRHANASSVSSRFHGVVEVRLVEIDVVAAEPAERISAGSDHMGF